MAKSATMAGIDRIMLPLRLVLRAFHGLSWLRLTCLLYQCFESLALCQMRSYDSQQSGFHSE